MENRFTMLANGQLKIILASIAFLAMPVEALKAQTFQRNDYMLAQASQPGRFSDRADEQNKIDSILVELRTSSPQSMCKVVPALLDALINSSDQTIARNTDVFRRELAGDAGTLAVLLKYLQGKDKEKSIAARMLLSMSYDHGFAVCGKNVSILEDALRTEPDLKVRSTAARVLSRACARKLAYAKEALIKGLAEDVSPEVRLQCCLSLGDVGKEEYFGNSESTVQALTTALLKDENDRVRAHAAFALGQMGEKASGAVSVLCKTATDNSAEVRGSSLQALGMMGMKAEPAIPLLIDVLAGPDEYLNRGNARYLAATALSKMGAKAAPAVPALTGLLLDDKARIQAANALKEIGPAAAPAAGNLIIMLGSPDCFARDSAAGCLGYIGPKAKRALPALRIAAKDQRNLTNAGSGNVERAQKSAQNAISLIEAGP